VIIVIGVTGQLPHGRRTVTGAAAEHGEQLLVFFFIRYMKKVRMTHLVFLPFVPSGFIPGVCLVWTVSSDLSESFDLLDQRKQRNNQTCYGNNMTDPGKTSCDEL
jgi:hypothetical protein